MTTESWQDRIMKPEVRGQNARGQRSEARSQKPEVRKREAEGRDLLPGGGVFKRDKRDKRDKSIKTGFFAFWKRDK